MEPSKNLCHCSLSHLKKENNAITGQDKLKHPSTNQNRSSSSSNPKPATSSGWKSSKRASSNPKSSSSKKGPAQRGLGVAQLERLRLSQMNPSPPPSSSSPLSYCSDPADSFMCSCCYNTMGQQQQYRAVGTFGPGPGTVSPIIRRPLHFERSSTLMINRPVMEGIFGARAAWAELPSNQTPIFISSPMKKRGAMEDLGFTNGGAAGSRGVVDYFAVNQEEVRNNGYSEREIKEYQFFPRSPCSLDGDDSEPGYPTASAAASTSSTDTPHFVDLSLKLF